MPATPPLHHLAPLCRDLEKLVNDLRNSSQGSQPSEAHLQASPLLDRWSFAFLPAPCLKGSVHQHPTLGSCSNVHTSELVLIDPHKRWARTWSGFYRLGKQLTPEIGNT
ncbi:hypothetical protein H8A97_03540 [Bradyrhizobium sp. Arg62]|uniref:DUF6634 family protein n=1 Tax=Bradyrhizobium brasilense TaxID=1419277 RepID=UPI001E28456D|nr:DUF6634 family protein [Bradyrhizobium brasilense]MCC8944196.1 hypothetical protein [Bradyrhizobium brasilense]